MVKYYQHMVYRSKLASEFLAYSQLKLYNIDGSAQDGSLTLDPT